MTKLHDNLFDLLLEADEGDFRKNYFTTLANLNRFGRLDSSEATLEWVRFQLRATMDKMCAWVELPEVFEYESDLGELGFSLFRFN